MIREREREREREWERARGYKLCQQGQILRVI